LGAISLQALALFLALAPGCAFVLGFHANSSTTKLETQRGVLMDTALFVLAAALLHGLVGVAIIYAFHLAAFWNGGCDVVRSVGHLFRPGGFAIARSELCSVHTGIALGMVEFLLVVGAAWLLGRKFYRVTMRRAGFAEALYGAYYELNGSDDDPIVIANVMTDIECDGQILMYEGKLLQLALSSNRAVKYVCLQSPRRFLMSISKDGARTTEREKFIEIDQNGHRPSRITINGENIKNILTRTHYLKEASYPTEITADGDLEPKLKVGLKRRSVVLPQWAARAWSRLVGRELAP
jgi:hypothetical protein